MVAKRQLTLVAACVLVSLGPAHGQVQLEVTEQGVRRASGVATLDDLAVHDKAFINSSYCIKDGAVYVPGWTESTNLAETTYDAGGLALKVEVLPGRRLKGVLVDALQAKHQAQGRTTEESAFAKEEYNREVRAAVRQIFTGGLFGMESCDDEAKRNPLRRLNLFTLESINGFATLSDLLSDAVPEPPTATEPKRGEQ